MKLQRRTHRVSYRQAEERTPISLLLSRQHPRFSSEGNLRCQPVSAKTTQARPAKVFAIETRFGGVFRAGLAAGMATSETSRFVRSSIAFNGKSPLEATRANNAVTEGQRKVVGVMHKDAKRLAATGGWGFEGFGGGDPNNRVVGKDAASACFACHQPQKDQDYTFSQPRD